MPHKTGDAELKLSNDIANGNMQKSKDTGSRQGNA